MAAYACNRSDGSILFDSSYARVQKLCNVQPALNIDIQTVRPIQLGVSGKATIAGESYPPRTRDRYQYWTS
jgi:hypothetical protein